MIILKTIMITQIIIIIMIMIIAIITIMILKGISDWLTFWLATRLAP